MPFYTILLFTISTSSTFFFSLSTCLVLLFYLHSELVLYVLRLIIDGYLFLFFLGYMCVYRLLLFVLYFYLVLSLVIHLHPTPILQSCAFLYFCRFVLLYSLQRNLLLRIVSSLRNYNVLSRSHIIDCSTILFLTSVLIPAFTLSYLSLTLLHLYCPVVSSLFFGFPSSLPSSFPLSILRAWYADSTSGLA